MIYWILNLVNFIVLKLHMDGLFNRCIMGWSKIALNMFNAKVFPSNIWVLLFFIFWRWVYEGFIVMDKI